MSLTGLAKTPFALVDEINQVSDVLRLIVFLLNRARREWIKRMNAVFTMNSSK